MLFGGFELYAPYLRNRDTGESALPVVEVMRLRDRVKSVVFGSAPAVLSEPPLGIKLVSGALASTASIKAMLEDDFKATSSALIVLKASCECCEVERDVR